MEFDRGLLLAIYSVLSGWVLVLGSLLLIKAIISVLGTRGFLIAMIEVIVGFLALSGALYLWYMSLRTLFLRVKLSSEGHSGPGGT